MKNRLQEPLNAEERYLYEINIRLNILIEMFSSFLDVYASDNKVATTNNEIKEEVVEEKFDYNVLTKAEIMDILDRDNVEYSSRMTKAQLIELLEK